MIDPGRAFGTGAHPTTQLCLQLLIDVADHRSALDIGCGSGVLAIAASKLGFEPVIALDHDPVTLEAAATNARANDVTIDLRLIEALEDELPEADTAVANISATAIETVARRVRAKRLITSGYLATERPEAGATATSSGESWTAGRPTCGAHPSRVRLHVSTFSVRFLGCKVSYSDAQEIRERLLRDGHDEVADGADVAVVNACCVTHEAVRKSRHAAARAARTHGRVFVTGCGANLAGDGFAGLPDNITVVRGRSEATPDLVADASGRSAASRPTPESTASAPS